MGRDAVETVEMAHPGRQPALRLRHVHEPGFFLLALDGAHRVQAERQLSRARKSQLRVRDAHLGGPPRGVDLHRRFPHGVPRVICPRIVVDRRVALDARRADGEDGAGDVVVMRIQEHRERVRLGILVAARQLARDPGRLSIVHPRRHVQRVVVVGNPQLGVLRDRLPFFRVLLRERRRRRRPEPDFVVQEPIDDDRGGGLHGMHRRNPLVRRPGLRR